MRWNPFRSRRPPLEISRRAICWAREEFPSSSLLTSAFVTDVIVESLGVGIDQVKPETRFIEDLSADGLDNVEIVLAIEEALEVSITEDEAETITTVAELIAFLDRQGVANG